MLNAVITALINAKSAKLDKIKFIGIDTDDYMRELTKSKSTRIAVYSVH